MLWKRNSYPTWYWSNFNMILKRFSRLPDPSNLAKCIHWRGITNPKKKLFALGVRKWPRKVAKQSSNWLPKSIQNTPKTRLEFNVKIWWDTEIEIVEFRLQNWFVCLRFLLLTSTSKGTWSPAGVLKIDTYYADIVLETNINEEFQAPRKSCDFVWIKLPSPLNGLAVCAKRWNKGREKATLEERKKINKRQEENRKWRMGAAYAETKKATQ